jgi:transposase
VIGDCGYDSNELRNNNTAVIPGRKDRKETTAYGKGTYKKRGLIERIFGKLKETRPLAVRYEKLDLTFLGFIKLDFANTA